MAMKEVARLTNVIYWDSDKSSWRKEVKRLEDYKKSWKKATDDIAKADFKSNQAVLRTRTIKPRLISRWLLLRTPPTPTGWISVRWKVAICVLLPLLPP